MTLTTLEASVRAAEGRVERRIGEARRVLLDAKAAQQEVSALEARSEVLDEVIEALNSYADQRQVDLQAKVEQLVTHGLRIVFGEDLEFHLVPGMKGKYATTDFMIRSRQGEEWIETPVLQARGGGVAAVVGFVIRVILLLLRPNSRHTLFLDETFAQLSEDYEEPLANFIRELVDRTDCQVVLVTHSNAYDAVADVAYRLRLEDGVTKVEKVS
jgi:ABC-type glutathione transport system ATPase component